MNEAMCRRGFLGAVAAGAALRLAARQSNAAEAGQKLVVGVMGMGGRGTQLATLFDKVPGVDVACVCDVDARRAAQAAEAVGKVSDGPPPRAVQDFRRILDDKAVDALVIATCNHWHAPAAILACAAGKHVYVEKPCSHNPREGELLVAAAWKHKRLVQMGNQARSMPATIEAVEQLRGGAIGRVYYAQSWYLNTRPSIGVGKPAPEPEGLDYELWQGPAPRRPFKSNYLHYNWHWFWHWGNGELGNNGVHTVDTCRWGLGVDYPVEVASVGGRFRHEDDQETPDTNVATFRFADRKMIAWEGLSCNRMPEGMAAAEIVFHGEKGSIALHGGGYSLHDPAGKQVKRVPAPGGDPFHVANFVDAIRKGTPLNSEIEEGHKSTLLCHLGNIAYRVGRSLRCDPANGHILGDDEAMKLWGRDYEKGWEPKV